MTFEELDREIELKIEELSNKKEKKRYLYIVNFNNKIDNINDFKGFNAIGFISAYYYLHHKELNMEDVNNFISNLVCLFENINSIEIDEIIPMLLAIKKSNKLDILKKYLSDDGNISHLNELKKVNAMIPLKMMNIKKIVKQNNIDISSLIDAFNDNDQVIINIITFYQTYQKMMMLIKDKEKQHDFLDIKSFEKVNSIINCDNLDKMVNMLDEIDEYVNEYLRESKKNKKEIDNLSNAREKLEEALEKKDLIVNYLDIINNIKDLRLKNMFLQVIKNHNIKYLNKLEGEYSILTKDTRLDIIALLNDYGIIKNSYNLEIIMRYSKEDIEKILKVISLLNVSNETKVFILENANITNVNIIKDYLDRAILNAIILNDNLDMFTATVKLDNLKNNLDIIKKGSLSISLFISNINVLLEDSRLFNKNLNILSIYNLIKSIDTCNDLSYLLRNDLDTVIDKYLELGCEKYLEKDLSLLNKRNLQKLEMLNILGIGVNSKEELFSLLMDDSNFNIDINEMSSILSNNKIALDMDQIEINLDDYRETNRVYSFDGIRVSIIKVKRLLSMGYNLYDAITYNMYLKEEDQKKLINILKGNNMII